MISNDHFELESVNCGLYAQEYDTFRTFALNSLDEVKPFLLALNFPVFVHSYLGLVMNGSGRAARDFFDRYSGSFWETYHEEVTALSMVTTKEQLTENEDFLVANPFVRAVLQSKFSAKVSKMAYKVLLPFLIQSDFHVLTAIINEHVEFVKLQDTGIGPGIVEGGGGGGDAAKEYFAELKGYDIGADAGIINTGILPSVWLGVPGHSYASTSSNNNNSSASGTQGSSSSSSSSAATRISDYPDTRNDKLYKDLLENIVRPRSMLRKRGLVDLSVAGDGGGAGGQQQGASYGSSGSSHIGRHREAPVARGNVLEPSIVFSSLTNTYDGMTCMHVNSRVTQIASGHKDCSVHVWRLDNNRNGNSNNNTSDSSSNSGGSNYGRTVFGKHIRPAQVKDPTTLYDTVLPSSARHQQQHSSSSSNSNNSYNNNNSNSNNPGFDALTGSAGLPSGTSTSTAGVSRADNDAIHKMELRGHTAPVYSVAQSSCDRMILSASADESIRLWDTAVAQCVGKYSCMSPVWDVAFSPTDYHFASANQDRTVTVFATDRANPLRIMNGHTSDVNCVAWHSNSAYVLSGSDDKTCRLYDIRSARSVRTFTGCAAAVTSVAWSTTGNVVAAGVENGKIYLWDAVSGRQFGLLVGHNSGKAVHSLSFAHDDTALCSGGADCSVRVWSLAEAYSKGLHQVYQERPKESFMNSIGGDDSMLSGGGDGFGGGVAAGGGGGSGSSGSASYIMPSLDAVIIKPYHTFFTKYTPVYYLRYSRSNFIYAGGPFCPHMAVTSTMTAISGTGSSATASAAAGGGIGADNKSSIRVVASEEEAADALHISRAVVSGH